jgi:hypothetical protein
MPTAATSTLPTQGNNNMMNIINYRLNNERAANINNNNGVVSGGIGMRSPSPPSSPSSVSSSLLAPNFPMILHALLSDSETMGFQDIVCWMPGGQVFKIHDPDRFASDILPRYFNQTKYKSFQRQCNIYGFQRVHHGPHRGGYTHQFFIQGAPELVERVKRETVTQVEEVQQQVRYFPNVLFFP